jgi:hypothetical protein
VGDKNNIAIVAADFHVPFVSIKYLQKLLLEIDRLKPDKLVLAGDYMDFYGISKFDSAPTRADDLQYELTCGKEIFEKIRKVFDGEIVFIPGNHETRLQTFLSRGKNKSLFNLACLKIEELLNFSKYKITLSDLFYHLNDNFIITHGTKCGQSPAQAEALSMGISGMSGHCHKSNKFFRNYFGRSIEWHSTGCMCDIDKIDYAATFNHTWNNGFASVEYTKTNFKVVDYR